MSLFIAIDGLDGSGKKTQSEILYDTLISAGKKAMLLSFPNYGTPACAPVEEYLGGAYGSDPESVNCYAASSFYAVDRYSSYKLSWEKEYKSGTVMISNRYTTANAIHQHAKLPENRRDEFLDWLYDLEFVRLGLPVPDVTLFLDVPTEISLSLIEKRGEKKDIHETAEHLAKAREAALYTAEKWNWKRIECVSEGKLLPIECISEKIAEVLKSYLG